MTTPLAIRVFLGLLLAPVVSLLAQDHPRAPQQSQSQQLPQTRTGAPQAAMTEATMSDVSAGLKEFISGYASKSADKKFHMPYNRKDLALDLIKVHDNRFSSLGGNKYLDRKSTRLNSSHITISYAVFCLKKKNNKKQNIYTIDSSSYL